MKQLRGKFLLRKSTLQNGSTVLTMTGVFPSYNFDIEDGDEMWVADVVIQDGGFAFSNPSREVSPEDFLSGENQNIKEWKTKKEL